MLELVTVQEAADHIRTDSTADNPWFQTWIPAISAAVASWLKDTWRLYMVARDAQGVILLDSAGEPIVLEDSSGPIINPIVRAATLVELSQQYRFRMDPAQLQCPPMLAMGMCWAPARQAY